LAFRNNKTGSAIPHLNKELFFNMPFPVPPLAEQERIVAKIEELMPLVEEYGEAEERLTTLNAEFPDKLRKSILQQAIQGKLTERDPADEPASELLKRIRAEKERLIKEGKIKKEKPLPPITEEEMPFEIPENWEWTRLGAYLDVRDGTHDSPEYVQHGFPLVTSKNLKNGVIEMNDIKYITKEDYDAINERSQVNEGDILFAMIGSIGNPSIVGANHEYAIKNVALFKQVFPVNEMYLYYYLIEEQDSMKKKASGGVQPFVSLGYLRNYLLPVPPLAEQQRIVDRVNELLAVCGEIRD
ncbi:MAG: restriction endonuclease subunit S, partial [Clostridia bacterium]|nr:restriction endonuclease subunit S [Clostridia bacterium]